MWRPYSNDSMFLLENVKGASKTVHTDFITLKCFNEVNYKNKIYINYREFILTTVGGSAFMYVF